MRAPRADYSDSDDFGRRAVRFAGAVALAVGTFVLVGWALDSAAMKCVLPGLPGLKANAALGFVLLGIALSGQRTKRPGVVALSYTSAASLLVLAVTTLTEHILDLNLGIDELLFSDPQPTSLRFLQPGRMSPVTAASFLLLAAAILQNPFRSRVALCTQQLCLLLPLLVAMRSLVGWLYGVPIVYPSLKIPMSLHAIVAFQVVSIALLLSRRDFYLARLHDGSAAGSAIARRVFLWAIAAPVVIGLLCLQGERMGLYQGPFSVTMLVVLMALCLVVFLVAWCGLMNKLDRQRELATVAARDFQQASENDHLTGLLNRRGFLERSEKVLARSRRDGSRLACLVLDIDFFKKINDAHGHSTGDEVIRQFAAVLKRGCRPGDVLGRLGGEEFCVLLPSTDEDDAKLVAEQLRVAIGTQPFGLGLTQLTVSMSGGVAELRPFHTGVHSLIDSADAALLVAKQTGRNKVVTASSLEEGDVAQACGGPLRKVQIRDIMVPVLASVGLETPVSQAAQQLIELNLDSLPVVDAAGKVTGFVTDQDVMSAMLDARVGDQLIASCNHVSVAIFDETVAAEEIAQFFSRSAVQRVIIVRHGIPVGLVSRRTLLRWLLNHSLKQSAQSQSGASPLPRGGLDESIRQLAAAVSCLTKLDAAGSDDRLSSTVVSEATRIQESVEALLTRCRPRRAGSRNPDLVTTGALTIA